MSENGEIYTAGKSFTLPPAVTAWTNSTSASQQGSTGREHFYVEFIFHRNVQDRSLRGSLIVCQRFSYFCLTEIISEKCLCYVFVIESSISSNWCRTPEYDIKLSNLKRNCTIGYVACQVAAVFLSAK